MDPNQQYPQQPQQPQQPMPQQPQAPVQPQQYSQPQQNPYQYPQQQQFQQPYPPQQQGGYQQPYQPSYARPAPDPQPMPQSAYDAAFATETAAPGISKWPIIIGGIGLLLGVGLLGFVMFGGGDSATPAASIDEEVTGLEAKDESTSAAAEGSGESAQQAAAAPIPVGKTVELRAASLAFDVTVVEVIRGATSSNEFRTPDEGFENVMVKLRVANKGEIERSFFASNMKLQVAGGEPVRNSSSYAEFSQPDDWPDYAPAYDANDRISAGGTGEGYIMYILPDDASSVEAIIDWKVNVIGGDDVDETFTVPLY